MKRDNGYLAAYGRAVRHAQRLNNAELIVALSSLVSGGDYDHATFEGYEDTMMDRLAAIHGNHGIPDDAITWADPESVERGYPHA